MENNPVIIIPGIGQSKLNIVDDNGDVTKTAWPFELDEKALMNDIKGSLMKMVLFKKDGGFSDKVAKIVKGIAEPLGTNPDGSKKYNVKAVTFDKPLSECSEGEKKYIYKIVPIEEYGKNAGEDKIFFFAFDPFGDLFDLAADLDKFVSFVKEKTGSEKVDFICVSVGGGLLRAYLMGYANKGDIDKIVNVVSALDGTELAADLFENKVNFDDPVSILQSLGGKAKDLSSMMGMLPKDAIDNVISKSLDIIHENLLYSCTSMWAMIPNDRFDDIYAKRSEVGIDPVLDSKIKAFHEYTADFPAKAKKLTEEKEIKFYNICGFGKKMIPIVASENISSDGIIDIHSSSQGITQCEYNEEPDVLSAAFPDTTWLFRNQSHNDTAYNDVALSLIVKILTGEVEDVHSSASYPQFNGTRNLKKLKYSLIPKAEKKMEESDDDTLKTELNECISKYNDIISDTIIDNDANVKELEAKLTALLDAEKK